jgi:hypothetical protein
LAFAVHVHNASVTAQVADSVELDGQDYSIAGVRGGPLFDPGEHRIKPGMISTACWRGYICWYRVEDSSLHLVRLVVGSGTKVGGRKLGADDRLLGVRLRAGDSWTGPGWEVSGIDLPVPFTGGLLLGRRFIQAAYVHMGFHPAWKFQEVVELVADRGEVTATHDRSAELAAIRRRIQNGDLPDPDGPRGGKQWIDRTLTLGYDRSIPPDDAGAL